VYGYEGVSVITGAGELPAQSSRVISVGVVRATGTGSLFVTDVATLSGDAASRSFGTGTLLNADGSAIIGDGTAQAVGSGVLVSVSSKITGFILSGWFGSGDIVANISHAAGIGRSGSVGVADVIAT